MAQGGIPILGGGMNFKPMSITSQDAQLIEAQRLSIEDIARVVGVPLPIIGDLTNSTLSNVAELVSMWLSVGLGSLLENVEASFEQLFDMPATEKIELDESALLRTNFEARINGLTRAVQGGVYTINEARGKEGLHPVEHGDVPIVQMQMQPLGSANVDNNNSNDNPDEYDSGGGAGDEELGKMSSLTILKHFRKELAA